MTIHPNVAKQIEDLIRQHIVTLRAAAANGGRPGIRDVAASIDSCEHEPELAAATSAFVEEGCCAPRA